MKKILLASTALVATTGFAMADMSWSGSANMGLKYSDNGTTTIHNEIDLGMAASGETDNNIAWKVEMGVDSSVADDVHTKVVDAGSVSITGDFGTIRVGAASTAGTVVGIAEVGFDGIGMDDAAELGRNVGGTTPNVQWNYTMDDIALHVSTETSSDNMAAAMSWTSGSLAIALSHASVGTTNGATATAGSISTSVSGFAVTVMAASNSDNTKDSLGMSASMPVEGLGSVTFVTGSNNTDAKSTYGIGFSKVIGEGVTLAGGFGSANGNSKADLGIGFSF